MEQVAVEFTLGIWQAIGVVVVAGVWTLVVYTLGRVTSGK